MISLPLKKQNIITVVLGIVFFFFLPLSVRGESQQEELPINFSYQNRIPKNQNVKGNYFDLLVKPETIQTLVTEVSNLSQKDIVVKVMINDAKTTAQGLIEYGPNKLKSVGESELTLTNILKGPSEIELKKGETKEIEFQLKMPKKEFKGVILGGIQLQEVKKEIARQEETKLENEYAYIFSVSVRETKEKADLQFSHERSYYENDLHDGKVKVMINNDSQEIAKEIKLESQVTSIETGEIVAELKRNEIKIAPMSIMAVELPYPNAKIGKYKVVNVMTINDRKLEFESEFEIKDKNLKGKGNKVVAVTKTKSWLPSIIIGTIILLGSGALYVIIRQINCKKSLY